MIGRRLTVQDNFGLGIIRPILEGGPEPRATCLAALPCGVFFHGGRPRSGSSTSSIVWSGRNWRSTPAAPAAGGRMGFCQKQADWSGIGHHEPDNMGRRKEEKLTTGGGLAREYGTLPYCQSSVSLQLEM